MEKTTAIIGISALLLLGFAFLESQNMPKKSCCTDCSKGKKRCSGE